LRTATRSLAVTACTLLVLSLSGVAAGANQNASPKKWVATLCGSLVTWEHTVKNEYVKLNGTIQKLKTSGNVKPVAAKAELVQFLGRIVKSTNTLVGDLKAVGAPSMKNGDKLQKALIAGLGQVQKAFVDAKASAKKLPTGSKKQFSAAAQKLGKQVQTSAGKANGALSSLSKYDTKELEAAFKATPVCSKLSG
jgi:hypothetical protein